MSKNKFGKYEVGQTISFRNEQLIIVDKFKGNKTSKINRQGGIATGFKSNPCLYKLNNGYIVRGDKLAKIN